MLEGLTGMKWKLAKCISLSNIVTLVHLMLTGGQRTWIQVLCNGGMATQLALLYFLDSGCGERPIDFARDYRASWLALGVLGK